MSRYDAYETIVGLEVHCQLATQTKLFSACGFRFGEPANTQTDPYTLALPGTLPVPNRRAVEAAVLIALAAGSTIAKVSRFSRKHYFYPDLPKGYQITQSDEPYALGGAFEFTSPTDPSERKRVRLVRIHIEEDAGKNVHLPGIDKSLIDYNRAGTPLVEIVSEPDLRSGVEAAAYLRELRNVVRALGISDGNMEEGSLRCDANVSIRPLGSTTLGVRAEIKNLNSFRFLEQAIEAEVRRQKDLLERGLPVIQATLSYDPVRDETSVMRTKEDAADYRYFPDPDLPPLVLDDGLVESLRQQLPELPSARRQRYHEGGLSPAETEQLVEDAELARFFDEVVAGGVAVKKAATFVLGEIVALCRGAKLAVPESPISAAQVVELAAMVDEGSLSLRTAKEVLGRAFTERCSPKDLVEREGLRQVADVGALEAIVRALVAAHPAQAAELVAGKTKLRGFFLGQVMKATGGQAHPGVVSEVLDRVLATLES